MTEQNNERSWAVIVLPVLLVVALAGGLAVLAINKNQQRAVLVGETGLETRSNQLGMQLVKIPAGRFVMGGEGDNQWPSREVEVASFYISAHEVTQAQWYAVMGYNHSEKIDPRRPVEQVSWLEVQAFLEQLNRLENTNKYRLPSEAEWEYAARAGSEGDYFFGDVAVLPRFAWFRASPNVSTRPVGSLLPNPWGLYDVYGNVWEWVQECWHPNHAGAPINSRVRGGGDCSRRTVKGGAWNNQGDMLGSAVRGSYQAGSNDYNLGFRVVLNP